ncbi:MAG: primosomal protein N' [Clostridia bacterium]|nr:primosomal protein N' [Clostridia bacterium]
MYASVIVDIGNTNVDRVFCYRIPDNMQVEPGHRVSVPFGASNRSTEGFVVSVNSDAPEGLKQLKTVTKTLEPYTVMLPDQLVLARWMANVYRCLYVDALRLMIPAQLRRGRISEKVVKLYALCECRPHDEMRAALTMKDGRYRSRLQGEVFELMLVQREMSAADISKRIPGSQSAVKALVAKGILTETGREEFRVPAYERGSAAEAPELTGAQRAAFEAVCGGIDAREGVFLLHGVTGSGKTEVYMRSIAYALERGGSAIVLVPEISLTPQTVSRFKGRFGDRIAVLHSRLSAGERYDEWRRIRLGMVDVVVGARSAVFAPLSQLRLIVIDEEHEASYQSESSPRYNAIEVAIKRCKLNGAALLLGSATPSLGDYLKAVKGRYGLLELNERVSSIPMPAVEVIDMRAEFMAGNTGVFSSQLKQALGECMANGEQAILFINRRGYSTFVSCRMCGHVFECDNCDVSMTYHSANNALMCHYCGARRALPTKCPECGSAFIKYFGVGTQQVENQLHELFPECSALRMDMDTTGTKDAHQRILSAFERGEAQVLIGTQMIAKGLDIPNVTLVGVVAADAMLHIPDYRSCERTFQLLTQVAGRAGRQAKRGRVIVQTYTPEHEAIRFASAHDFKGFYTYEIAQRRKALFPPFSLFARILFVSEDEERASASAREYADGLSAAIEAQLNGRGANQGEILMVEAAAAPVRRKQNAYRYQVLLRFARTKNLPLILDAIYRYHAEHGGECALHPEINPGDMF